MHKDVLKSLSLEQKLFQMFILGFSGTELNNENINIQNAIKKGLGGVIYFSGNIQSYNQAFELSKSLQKSAQIPLFISIDQEGGRVERTVNIKNKRNYLSAFELAKTKDPENARVQAETTAEELHSMGVNMNFAPVLDVNTNPNNPVINSRSFGDNTETVINFAKPVYKTFMNNSIIPVVKHFPGHGNTGEDSHLTMPVETLSLKELEDTHIKPFKHAIIDGVKAIMINHVYYKAFDTEKIPASLSENIISKYLREQLGFEGVVFSDDMVMGGIQNHYDDYESCIRGINAGIDVFIFRNSGDNELKLINKLIEAVKIGVIDPQKIEKSVERILFLKNIVTGF